MQKFCNVVARSDRDNGEDVDVVTSLYRNSVERTHHEYRADGYVGASDFRVESPL